MSTTTLNAEVAAKPGPDGLYACRIGGHAVRLTKGELEAAGREFPAKDLEVTITVPADLVRTIRDQGDREFLTCGLAGVDDDYLCVSLVAKAVLAHD